MSYRWFVILFPLAARFAFAQMPAMDDGGTRLMEQASGTSSNPSAASTPMIMSHIGHWSAMLMGAAFVSDIQQSGPRGGDKLYSTNWFMAAAEHRLGSHDAFEVLVMLSLEPATITGRRYPLLFQTGETAYGKPLIDAQHPHNFVMAASLEYVHRIAENTFLELYAAPVGDPALGPVAFPHRASAAEFPQAPISHHWQDSTHIADDVVTAGMAHRKFRLEASGFHGAEPGENRWTIQSGSIDSYSARLWYFPSGNWAAQVSAGRLAHPEALDPGDQIRVTSSLAYSLPMHGGAWSSTLIWGRVHGTATRHNLNSYLAESVLPVTRRNLLTGRFELVDKDELFGEPGASYRIAAYTAGYTRDIAAFRGIAAAIGANFSAYTIPAAIQAFYGRHPVGGNIFVRFRLR